MSTTRVERVAHLLFNRMEPTMLTSYTIAAIARDVMATLQDLASEECRVKFVAGAKEHGNNWASMHPQDLEDLIRDEIIDIVNYFAMRDYILDRE